MKTGIIYAYQRKTRHTLYKLETMEQKACAEPLLSKIKAHVNQSRQNHSFCETPLKPSSEHRCTGKEIPAGRDSDFIVFEP